MTLNPIKIYKIKQETEHNNWMVRWVAACVQDPKISWQGKIELLTSYYELTDHRKGKNDG